MQHGRTLLAGDAAHIITPCGGKGMNLALQDALVFAEVVERQLAGDGEALAEYSPRRLPDIWRAQEFSHWFLHMLNNYDPSAGSSFLQKLQAARLQRLEDHPEVAAHFATAYVGPE
jgi:p-hydroxybenzoate 3-monooxygenase